MNQALQVQFFKSLNEMERLLKVNVSQLGLETLTNAIYYFCKFQAGQQDFWQMLETNILK